MISEAILEPLEQWRSLVGSVWRSGGGGVVEIPLLGSSPLIKSRGEGRGIIYYGLCPRTSKESAIPSLRLRD